MCINRAHVFGQTCELYTVMAVGSAIGIVNNRYYYNSWLILIILYLTPSCRDQILESFQLIKPTAICSVPQMLNRVCVICIIYVYIHVCVFIHIICVCIYICK